MSTVESSQYIFEESKLWFRHAVHFSKEPSGTQVRQLTPHFLLAVTYDADKKRRAMYKRVLVWIGFMEE